MLVWSRRSRPGSRFSVMRFWFDLTATPLHTHREQSTSKTWQKKEDRNLWRLVISSDVSGVSNRQTVFNVPDLMVASMFIQQRDNWLDVILLDDVQHLWTLNQNTIQHLQDTCHKNVKIYKYNNTGGICLYSMLERHTAIQHTLRNNLFGTVFTKLYKLYIVSVCWGNIASCRQIVILISPCVFFVTHQILFQMPGSMTR